MKYKLNKLLSFTLCLTMIAPTLTSAMPAKKSLPTKETSTYVGTPSDALPEILEDVDIPDVELPTNILASSSIATQEQRTFLDYFPDPNFAQVVAEELGRNKNDTVSLELLSEIKSIDSRLGNITSIAGIEYLANLQSLVLSYNQITEIPESIGQITKLQELYLHSNQITKIPESIGQLANLQDLSLFDNQITEIPETFRQLTMLQSLTLANNQITEFPEAIVHLTKLQFLTLANNQITEIPETFGQLTMLQYLTLTNNQITEIPETFGQLTMLQDLSLSDNQISNIPETIFQLTKLRSLDLNNNQITVIPETIGQLTELQSLQLGYNQITVIPETIGQLTKLQYLELHKNQICSPVPESLFALKKFYLNDQYCVLPALYFSNSTEITYKELISPLIFQTKENNNGNLAGTWSIIKPDGSTISIAGGNGSEINSSLFNESGTYLVSFQWTSKEPYPDLLHPWPGYSTLNFNSQIEITVGQLTEYSHQVTLITKYLDDAQPENRPVFSVANGVRFEHQYDILDGYTVYTSQLRTVPDFEVDSATNTVSIDPVNKDYTIELEFGRKLYEVEVITRYLDNALPESSQYYEVEHGTAFQVPYDVLDNYSLYTSELRSIPDFDVDTTNHLIALNPVERNHTIILEFDKTEYEVLLTTSYQDNVHPEQVYEDWIRHADGYSRTIEIAEGYQIANLDQLPAEVTVSENTIIIDSVTQHYDLHLELTRKQHDIVIRVVYEDGSREDQISTYTIPHGDTFNTSFVIDRGYTVNRVNTNALGVVVNHVRKTVSINQVNSPVEITISLR